MPDLMQSFCSLPRSPAPLPARSLRPVITSVISHDSKNADEGIANNDLLVSRKVDGLIIASAQTNDRVLRKLKTPYVFADREIEELNGELRSCPQRRDRISRHETHDRTRIPPHRASERHAPLHGYRAVAGLCTCVAGSRLEIRAEYVVEAGHDDAAGETAMRRLLASSPRPDGVFCFNDPLGSMLNPRVLSPTGGETEFANTYAAYEDLPRTRSGSSTDCRPSTRSNRRTARCRTNPRS